MKKLFIIFTVLFFAGPVVAAVDTSGCEDETKTYITPELALCSTHVYNIGLTENPDNSSIKELTKNVVALKTQLITQQMYAQYKFLDQALKQLKTQLQKEVQLAKLKAVSGGNDSDSGGGASGQTLATSDCRGKSRTDTVYCLRQNNMQLRAMVSNNQYSKELREQIIKDAQAARSWNDTCDGLKPKSNEDSTIACIPAKAMDLKKDEISNCIYQISTCANKIEEEAVKQNNTNTTRQPLQ